MENFKKYMKIARHLATYIYTTRLLYSDYKIPGSSITSKPSKQIVIIHVHNA